MLISQMITVLQQFQEQLGDKEVRFYDQSLDAWLLASSNLVILEFEDAVEGVGIDYSFGPRGCMEYDVPDQK